jgi:4a-hydroxytetrahydrobiopterin dehydratase
MTDTTQGPPAGPASDLASRHCQSCEGGTPPLSVDAARELLKQLQEGWELNEPTTELSRTLRFKNYYETLAFVNAVAWIAHREDHHPNLEVGYNRCRVRYSTHSIGGLSENDLICAAKVDGLLRA